MPSINQEVNKKARNKWYQNNKEKQIKRQSERRASLLLKLNEYKSTLSCRDCGMSFLGKEKALDFHHVDKTKKDGLVREMMLSSEKRMWNEIEKCIPLCANCHRLRH